MRLGKLIILPAQIFQIYHGNAFQDGGLRKTHAKGNMKMPKLSALPSMSSGDGGKTTRGQWLESLGWCQWDRGSSPLGKGAGLGHLTFFLVFRHDMRNKLAVFCNTHLLHMQTVLPFEKKNIVSDILNQRTNFMAAGRDEICFIKWLTLDAFTFSTLSAHRFTESSRVLVSADSGACPAPGQRVPEQGVPG